MTGKVTGRNSGTKCLDTQSTFSMNSVRTVDRDKLRDKARQFQMKENLRLAMCARLQQQLKKSPKVAEELASEVLTVLQQRGLPPDVSTDALAAIVHELSARRNEQLALAAAASKGAGPEVIDDDERATLRDKLSGRRLTSRKDASARSRGPSGSNKDGSQKPMARTRGSVSGTAAGRGGASNAQLGVDDDVYVTQAQLQQLSTGFRLPPRVSPAKAKNNGIWEEIVQFSSVEEQAEAARKQELKRQQRAELTERLSAQVHQRQHKTALEREASEQFHRTNMQRLHELEDDERRKEQQRLERAKQLIAVQTEQRLAKMQQHEREAHVKKAQAATMLEKLRRQKDDDDRADRMRREREQERLRLVFAENQAQLEAKRRAKESERVLEVKLADDYVRSEDAKEAARREQLDAVARRIQAKMQVFGDTAKADMDARVRDEEQRVQRCQEDYARQQAEAERTKRADAEARSRAQQAHLRQQMAEKKLRDAAAKRELDTQAELWQLERADAERRERLALQQRAQRNATGQELLRQQMRDKEQRLLEADQTALEVQLNTSLLAKIHKQTGSAQANGAVVVSSTQHRSRELQEKEQALLQQQRPSRSGGGHGKF